ncbi:MAG: hypothetical protein ACKVWV_12665 [Planctomycetota bacterium]
MPSHLLSTTLFALALAVPGSAGAVLKGFDPVALTNGQEVAGDPTRVAEHHGFTYAFASDEHKRRFESDPERFAIQLGGACARMGPLSGKCDQNRFAVHDGRIYVFASDACRASFSKDPAAHVDREQAPLDDAGLDRAAGRALLDRVIAALGGAAQVDALKSYRWTKRAQQESGGKTYATHETVSYRFPDDMRRDTAWDDWTYRYVDTPREAFAGSKTSEPLAPLARSELRRQLGRDVLYLARQREREGFDAAAAGTQKVGDTLCDVLVIRCGGARTTLFVEQGTARVVRTAWRGRFESGPNTDVAVDYSDFRSKGALVLPHARHVTVDGKPVAHASGAVDEIDVDVELADSRFTR